MAHKPYHHGNLRDTLIESGIELINADGLGQFSLRKVATVCGVSHAAPYNHFKDKEELLAAMQDYVTGKFAAVLRGTIQEYERDPELIIYIGKAYVQFFAANPHYFQFLIIQSDLQINFGGQDVNSNFQPFELFKKVALKSMEGWGLPENTYVENLITMWAVVHGIVSMAIMKGVHYDGDWGELVETILREKISFRRKSGDEDTGP